MGNLTIKRALYSLNCHKLVEIRSVTLWWQHSLADETERLGYPTSSYSNRDTYGPSMALTRLVSHFKRAPGEAAAADYHGTNCARALFEIWEQQIEAKTSNKFAALSAACTLVPQGNPESTRDVTHAHNSLEVSIILSRTKRSNDCPTVLNGKGSSFAS